MNNLFPPHRTQASILCCNEWFRRLIMKTKCVFHVFISSRANFHNFWTMERNFISKNFEVAEKKKSL